MSPETAAAIDQIQVTLNAGGMNTINIVLAFVMFGVSLGIKPGTFIEVFSKPKSVLKNSASSGITITSPDSLSFL